MGNSNNNYSQKRFYSIIKAFIICSLLCSISIYLANRIHESSELRESLLESFNDYGTSEDPKLNPVIFIICIPFLILLKLLITFIYGNMIMPFGMIIRACVIFVLTIISYNLLSSKFPVDDPSLIVTSSIVISSLTTILVQRFASRNDMSHLNKLVLELNFDLNEESELINSIKTCSTNYDDIYSLPDNTLFIDISTGEATPDKLNYYLHNALGRIKWRSRDIGFIVFVERRIGNYFDRFKEKLLLTIYNNYKKSFDYKIEFTCFEKDNERKDRDDARFNIEVVRYLTHTVSRTKFL